MKKFPPNVFAVLLSDLSDVKRFWIEAHCCYCCPNRAAYTETYWPDKGTSNVITINQEAIYTYRTTNHPANESDRSTKQTANVPANPSAYLATNQSHGSTNKAT